MPRPRPFTSGTPFVVRVLALALAAGLAGGPVVRGADLAKATFAGGCFWCMEKPFEDLPGVVSVTSGYSGGQVKKPTYEQVSMGVTGHAESVQVVYDPAKVTYAQLLDVFWHNIDPVSAGGQFCDRGSQYRSAIFYADEEQRREAEETKKQIEAELQPKQKKPVVTEIVAFTSFWPAEDYHQDFYKKNPFRYNQYRFGCGRDRRLKELWGAKAGGH
jgi:peptide-methionine (S)-S-oxide reductase